MQHHLASPEPTGKPSKLSPELSFEDSSAIDIDYFVKSLTGIKAKGVGPDLIASIITNYASKLLPDLLPADEFAAACSGHHSPESATASWLKKRFLVETLVGILPPVDKDYAGGFSCDFLLRLLRVANTVGVEPGCRAELERRVALQLDQASLGELMIPCFSHTCTTLLDVELVIRLVRRFVISEETVRSGAALVRMAKLVDAYLAEAALDVNLVVPDFIELASTLPGHARTMDDGLYRAIDTYLKAHAGVTKQERKRLCRLIDFRKLSPEASFHAAQNERLPVRSVIQLLFSEQTKLNKHIEWSGSFITGIQSPNTELDSSSIRCLSKRQTASLQSLEIKRLKDDVLRLQSQCMIMQGQIERLLERKKLGFFSLKRFGIVHGLKGNKVGEVLESNSGALGQTPIDDMKTRLVRGRTPNRWRKSMS